MGVCVAGSKENQILMVLDSPGWVLYLKNTNVKKIGCKDTDTEASY